MEVMRGFIRAVALLIHEGSLEEVRRLLRIREGLEERIRRLEGELEDLRRVLAEVDRLITHLGFRRADEGVGSSASLKGKSGMLLGTLRCDGRSIIFEPRGDIGFSASSPLFRVFVLERTLERMRGEDEGRASRGEISPDEVLSYDVETDGDRIVRLIIRNYGDERRFREIRSSLRWAFDRMYERLTSRG